MTHKVKVVSLWMLMSACAVQAYMPLSYRCSSKNDLPAGTQGDFIFKEGNRICVIQLNDREVAKLSAQVAQLQKEGIDSIDATIANDLYRDEEKKGMRELAHLVLDLMNDDTFKGSIKTSYLLEQFKKHTPQSTAQTPMVAQQRSSSSSRPARPTAQSKQRSSLRQARSSVQNPRARTGIAQ